MQNLPDKLYSVDSVVRLEQIAIKQLKITAYELMQRAGQAVFDVIKNRYPGAKKILVLCGAGNNAGDGYVLARMAKQAGFQIKLVSLIDAADLKGAALQAYNEWLSTGENNNTAVSIPDETALSDADVIVDSLLGTGLAREVTSHWAEWICAVNQSSTSVVAVDVPSGLLANTGVISGVAIQADVTVCFVALKQGMFTAQAKDVCGDIVFSNIGLPDDLYQQVEADAQLIKNIDYALLPKRKASSHKGNFGHVLIVGGNKNMAGAVILAAKAALRAGAGLVTVVTVLENLSAISKAVPEAMVKTCETDTVAGVLNESFIKGISHIAIGMGIAQDDWALTLLRFCTQLAKPVLIDADALNLLAQHDIRITSPLVVTPHPGEAARLLSTTQESTQVMTSANIQQDRFTAVAAIHALFPDSESCVVVLKGSGSLIFDGKMIKVCGMGNAAMAAPGMGDVLSGIIVGLMAQDIKIQSAAELGVCLHACAADSMMQGSTRGLLASDVVDALPDVLQ